MGRSLGPMPEKHNEEHHLPGICRHCGHTVFKGWAELSDAERTVALRRLGMTDEGVLAGGRFCARCLERDGSEPDPKTI